MRTRTAKMSIASRTQSFIIHSTNCPNKIRFYHEHTKCYVVPAFTVHAKLTNGHTTERNCELAKTAYTY